MAKWKIRWRSEKYDASGSSSSGLTEEEAQKIVDRENAKQENIEAFLKFRKVKMRD